MANSARSIARRVSTSSAIKKLFEPLQLHRGALTWNVNGVWIRYEGGTSVTVNTGSIEPLPGDRIVDTTLAKQMTVVDITGFDGSIFTLDCRTPLPLTVRLEGPEITPTLSSARPPSLDLSAPALADGEMYRYRLRRGEDPYWFKTFTSIASSHIFRDLTTGAWVAGVTRILNDGTHTQETETAVAVA